MRAYGKRKTRTPLAGHQDCGVCHSDNKTSATRERQAARREIATAAVAWPPECGVDLICDACLRPTPRMGAWVFEEQVLDWQHEALAWP